MRRFLIWSVLSGLLVLMIVGVLAADRKRSADEEKLEALEEFSGRLSRLSSDPDLTEEQRFLHERVAELMTRAREAEAGSYLFGRLEETMDDLLDASGELRQARRNEGGSNEEGQERTARDLERTYFRVRQGDYFARQSGDSHADDYIRLAQRLYQQARAAYDIREFRRARSIADAAREVIEGLENLAQAAVRVPEPPKL